MYTDRDIIEVLYELQDRVPLVDLRSPGEYEEATIPGAFNVPLLDNVERSLVGKTYKQEGSARARELAMEIVSPRLPGLVKAVKHIAPAGEVVVFCWRGGDRSHFTACILDAMGFKVHRVRGGFKAYRRHVLQYLERKLPHRAVVVHGLTGVGKTELLLELKRRGHPVLDLEGLALHRGSVFGKIGLPPSPGQKMFEGLIENTLRHVEKAGFFLVECESRRLGKLLVPGSVMEAMHNGYRILAYAGVKKRVQRIIKDYVNEEPDNPAALREAVCRLTRYLGNNRVAELNRWLDAGDVEQVVEFLLVNYYDPLYKYPGCPDEGYDLSVNTEDIAQAADEIGCWLSGITGHKYHPGG